MVGIASGQRSCVTRKLNQSCVAAENRLVGRTVILFVGGDHGYDRALPGFDPRYL